jgi:hypothetical protein
VRAWSLKSGAIERGLTLGQQPLAEQQRDQDHAGHQRHAHERELEEAEPARAGGVGDDHVDRCPGQRQQRARVRAEGQREQQPRRRAARAHREHHSDPDERGDGAVDVDQRGQQRDQQHRVDDQPRPALPHARHQLLPDPGRHPRRLEPF